MHLIFQGVVADVMDIIDSFMREHSLSATFDKHVNKYLTELAFLRLDWCKIKTLPKAQWIAEDLLGFARIMPFVYSQFFLHLPMPDTTVVSAETLAAIEQLLNSLHVMVSLLMSPRDPDPDTIDAHVKIFLSCCDRFHRSNYESDVEMLAFLKDSLWIDQRTRAIFLEYTLYNPTTNTHTLSLCVVEFSATGGTYSQLT